MKFFNKTVFYFEKVYIFEVKINLFLSEKAMLLISFKLIGKSESGFQPEEGFSCDRRKQNVHKQLFCRIHKPIM